MGYLSKGDRITMAEQDIIDIIGALGSPLYVLRVNAAGTSLEYAAAGSGTVSSVAWTTSQGVSASIANATTTPNITITLGALTGVTSLNGLVVTANTGEITTGTWSATTIAVTKGGTGVTSISAKSIWVANSANTIVELSPAAGDSIRMNGAGTAWETFTPSASVPTTITVANEATDTTCFIGFFTAATGDLGPKTNANMTFNSSTGVVTFASSVLTTADINGGTLDGVVIGGASAAAANVTTLSSGATTSTGLLTISLAGNNVALKNTTDAASVQLMKLEGDRATMAANDEAYISFHLSDSAGNQDEMARITWKATTVTSTTEVSRLQFGVVTGGTLADELYLTSAALSPAADNGLDLGTTTLAWGNIHINTGGTINFENGNAVITHSAAVLTVSTGDLRVTTAGTNSASVVTVGGTQTLTAKTLTSPIIGTSPTAAGATWTDLGTVTTADINGGTLDGVVIGGASAAAATVTTLSAGAITSTGLLSVTLAGTVADFKNTTDNASVQVAKFEGDRATMAANDEGYNSYFLSDSVGTQTEFARMTWRATTVTDASEAGRLAFSVMTAGSLAEELYLTGTALSPAADGGNSLGTTALGWQNLFGNTGFVFNIENGDWVATHTAGILTVGTGDLRVTTAGTNTASVVTVGGSQTLTSKVLTSATITTGLTPTSNDGAALGSTSNMFSDLFLASGGVINFNNGNATITHSAGILTVVGEVILPTTGPTSVTTVGFRGIPQNSKSAAYTTVLADAGGHILHPSSDNNARTFTIDSNANVAYPIGTTITFINMINTVTIAITSDTMTLLSAGTTGSRTLAANGIATAVKISSTAWVISGTGLT